MRILEYWLSALLMNFAFWQGATVCAFYMKTGTCKFAAACKFDHPPPGEAIALATVQVTGGNEAASAEEK